MQEIAAEVEPEPGYDAWLRDQLRTAVADLDNPATPRLEHEAVFKALEEGSLWTAGSYRRIKARNN